HPKELHSAWFRATRDPSGLPYATPLDYPVQRTILMSPNELLAIGMVATFFGLLIIGIPVGMAIASSALIFGYLGFGPLLFNLLPPRIYGVVANYTLMAIPLFVFMGVMLEKSRLAEELLDVIGHLYGRMAGGMA